jgi:hypothetical protein
VLSIVSGDGEVKEGREVVVGLGKVIEGLNGDIEKEEEGEGDIENMEELIKDDDSESVYESAQNSNN